MYATRKKRNSNKKKLPKTFFFEKTPFWGAFQRKKKNSFDFLESPNTSASRNTNESWTFRRLTSIREKYCLRFKKVNHMKKCKRSFPDDSALFQMKQKTCGFSPREHVFRRPTTKPTLPLWVIRKLQQKKQPYRRG